MYLFIKSGISKTIAYVDWLKLILKNVYTPSQPCDFHRRWTERGKGRKSALFLWYARPRLLAFSRSTTLNESNAQAKALKFWFSFNGCSFPSAISDDLKWRGQMNPASLRAITWILHLVMGFWCTPSKYLKGLRRAERLQTCIIPFDHWLRLNRQLIKGSIVLKTEEYSLAMAFGSLSEFWLCKMFRQAVRREYLPSGVFVAWLLCLFSVFN